MGDKINKTYLWFICIVAALGGLLFGYDTAVISGTIGLLRNQFNLSTGMEGTLVSAVLLGSIVGCLIAGYFSDKFGRKKVLILAGMLFIVASIGCSIAPDINTLIIIRLLGGIGVGIASVLSGLYISEISPPNVRGRMTGLFQFAITIGILLALFVNASLKGIAFNHTEPAMAGLFHWMVVKETWRSMLLAMLVPALLFTISLFFVPESPRWLMKQKLVEKARRILLKITDEKTAEDEIKSIDETLKQGAVAMTDLLKPGLRKAFFVAMFLAIVSELSGITVIFYYGPDILEKAGLQLSDALGGFVSVGIVNVLFTIIALWKLDSIGRRPLLFIGNAGAFLSMLTLGFCFLTGRTEGMLLVLLICAFVAFFAFSMGPIKWVVMSEIFPTKIRGRAVAITSLAVWVTDWTLNMIFPMIRESMGIAGIFFLFSAFLVPQFFFIWKVMPETKGKTLEEIEQSWLHK
ncbi:MAG: sugar porter family MFS transporter [Prolixibacteraceae bacterium]|jgi:sugar porter (SP) family MFS transporter|nr:sugar porter family MFS transporter [Prolixibacteraceae bacterium]